MHPATPVFTSRRSAAIRVAAKVDSPEALDAALQLTEIDLPRDLPPVMPWSRSAVPESTRVT